MASHARTGFVEPARAFACAQAAGDWILVLDADELVPPGLARRLRAIADGDGADVVRVPRVNYMLGAPLLHSGWNPERDRQVRFWRRGAVELPERIHGHPVPRPDMRLHDLPYADGEALVHLSHLDVAAFLDKLNAYTGVEARQALARGERPGAWRALGAATREWLARYLRHGGWRDGWRGLYLSFFMAGYRLAAAAKLAELAERRHGGGRRAALGARRGGGPRALRGCSGRGHGAARRCGRRAFVERGPTWRPLGSEARAPPRPRARGVRPRRWRRAPGRRVEPAVLLARAALVLVVLASGLAVDPAALAAFDAPKRLLAQLGIVLAAVALLVGSRRAPFGFRALAPAQRRVLGALAVAVVAGVAAAVLSPRSATALPALRAALVLALLLPLGASRVLDGGGARRSCSVPSSPSRASTPPRCCSSARPASRRSRSRRSPDGAARSRSSATRAASRCCWRSPRSRASRSRCRCAPPRSGVGGARSDRGARRGAGRERRA